MRKSKVSERRHYRSSTDASNSKSTTLTPPIKDSVAKTGDLGATPVPSWSVFVSYCWRNSKDAFVRGQIDSDFGCGSCDPRVLATRLSAAGFPCWIDMEQLEVGEPLFEDLVDTIKRSKFAVICVSTEYADSENCKDEFKFIRKIKIPKIIVVVGPTHSVRDWSTTVIGFMASDAVYIDARGPSSFGLSEPTFQRILTAVQHGLLKPNNSEQVHAEFSLTDMRTMFLSGASTRDSDRFR
ncbi:hypothetical protein BCR33DRAFT_192610 [Rhizoclosmatium globosum]|uniref:TIR domain-containing protein n=1 Tax=Rhizoclosmatium globosum TaxID=329046 RepID=A0A1Y2D1Y4_9FUNG|nr:hypothetical protein BCR33DRAFT_192610 [Rhizoclosmatium globosum]|eukprot:ORY53301.1 hypothetical protein BCR33DRAFT_192610 [Rhizoclosmatium globosum]